jgi:hypothetical protein
VPIGSFNPPVLEELDLTLNAVTKNQPGDFSFLKNLKTLYCEVCILPRAIASDRCFTDLSNLKS